MMSRYAMGLSLRWGMGVMAALALSTSCGESQLDGKPVAVVSDLEKSPNAEATKPSQMSEKGVDNAEIIKAVEAEAASAPASSPAPKGDPNEGKKRPLFLDVSMSKVGFVGSKVTKDNEGHFEVFDGKAMLDGYEPKSFEVTVDTTSVQTAYPKLTAHLKDEDFFFVSKYPQARFISREVIRGGQGSATHTVVGELTLRAVTKKISFPISLVTTDAGATGLAEFKINRKDFGIVYAGMADDLIKDEVLLKLNLAFLDVKYRKDKP